MPPSTSPRTHSTTDSTEGLNRHFRQTVFSMRLSYSPVVPFSPFGPILFLHSSSLQTRRTFFPQPTTRWSTAPSNSRRSMSHLSTSSMTRRASGPMMRFTAFSGVILRSTPAFFSNSLIFFPRNDTPVSLANSTSESLLLFSPAGRAPYGVFRDEASLDRPAELRQVLGAVGGRHHDGMPTLILLKLLGQCMFGEVGFPTSPFPGKHEGVRVLLVLEVLPHDADDIVLVHLDCSSSAVCFHLYPSESAEAHSSAFGSHSSPSACRLIAGSTHFLMAFSAFVSGSVKLNTSA